MIYGQSDYEPYYAEGEYTNSGRRSGGAAGALEYSGGRASGFQRGEVGWAVSPALASEINSGTVTQRNGQLGQWVSTGGATGSVLPNGTLVSTANGYWVPLGNGAPSMSGTQGGNFQTVGSGTYASSMPTAYSLTEDDWRPVGFYQNGTINFEFSADQNSLNFESETATGSSYRVPSRNRNGGTRQAGGTTASAITFPQNRVQIFITVYIPGTQTIAFSRTIETGALFGVAPPPISINLPAGYTTIRVGNPEPQIASQTNVRVTWR